MGTHCGKAREEDPLPALQRNWCKTYVALLKLSLGSSEGEPWYTETVKIALTWDKPTDIYTRKERWAAFRHASDSSSQYHVPKRRSPHLNLFDMLSSDFYDQNNPVAALLTAFRKHFLVSGEAKEVVTVLMKLVGVLAACVICLYQTLQVQLNKHRRDLEGMLLSHLVRGELYLQLEELVASNEGELKAPLLQQYSLPPEALSSVAEIVTREAADLLKVFVSSENPFEKAVLLEQLDALFSRVPEQSRVHLAARTVSRTGLRQLPTHLRLTQNFYDVPSLLSQAFLCINTPLQANLH